MGKNSSKINILFLIVSIFLWLIVASWVFIVFLLSSENGFVSHERSLSLVWLFKSTINLQVSELFVRKLAIVIEFGFLAFTMYLAFNYTNGISEKLSYAQAKQKTIKHDNEVFIMYSFWLTALIAILNEYFQFFIEGRNPSILDVMIAIGSTCSILLISRIAFMIRLKLFKQEEYEYIN